jgi:hypothetical protein
MFYIAQNEDTLLTITRNARMVGVMSSFVEEEKAVIKTNSAKTYSTVANFLESNSLFTEIDEIMENQYHECLDVKVMMTRTHNSIEIFIAAKSDRDGIRTSYEEIHQLLNTE